MRVIEDFGSFQNPDPVPYTALDLIFPITDPKGFENPSGLGNEDGKLPAKISIS
jgi:hypothetical protein